MPSNDGVCQKVAKKVSMSRTVQKPSLRNSLLYIDLMLYRPKVICFRPNIYTPRDRLAAETA